VTCPREQDVLRGSAEGLAHAATCAECAESLELLSSARAVIGAGRPELDPRARARMWRQVELGQMQPRFGFTGFVPAALAVAVATAVFLLIFRPEPASVVAHEPQREGWALERGAAVRAGSRVTTAASGSMRLTKPGAMVEMLPSSALVLEMSELVLEAGQLEIGLVQGNELMIATADVRLRSLGGSFAVAIDATGTAIIVHEGAVEVGGEVVRAGEKKIVRRAQASAPRAEEEPVESLPLPKRRQVVRETAPEPALEKKSEIQTPPAEEAEAPAEAPKTEAAAAKEEPAIEKPGAAVVHRDTLREVDRIAQRADNLRLTGRFEEAVKTYVALAARADAEDYAEAALYRAAKILNELGKNTEARALLEQAHTRFPNGPLAPERRELEEKLDP
jgi:hypothetical protein